jgi:hypothetical protein
MSTAWEQTKRRYRVLHAALEEFADTAAVSPATRVTIDAVFGDFDEFLLAVQRRWQRSFDARLDLVLEKSSTDTAGALRRLVRELGRDLAETRALLDAYAGHPVLAPGEERHRAAVRAATGADPTELTAEKGCPAQRWWRRTVALSGASA